MFNKLSIRAERRQIEETFGALFQFPDIYRPRKIINGLEESTVPIITSDKQETIATSIWGLLPKKFQGDWAVFQKHVNTLTIPAASLESQPWYAQTSETDRCLLLVTGFYTTFIADGELLFFHMTKESGEPFCLAGISNELEDGFLTSSLITAKANKTFEEINNTSNQMPILIPRHQQKDWLDHTIGIDGIETEEATYTLTAEPIGNDFFYDSDSDANFSVLEREDFLPLSLHDLLYNNSINLSN
ncbi:SOS response-associated peptidase family protein [Zobellia alginiliquefaciens]|uniref:SOS response-associated peptidase family protein n=1 Tax=Zobellia alginiliquefaciens TaxID=3032586 RepID=UPI0023E0DAD2|nr:SOS response-associated peptidase family protein [Zobellia alginiliquefaciens]